MRIVAPVWLATIVLPLAVSGGEEPSSQPPDPAKLFARENLMAWCIVPFDAKKRGPEERAEMLARLGFKHFAYDWRAEHIPTFDAEIAALKKHGVALDAWWFPGELNAEARQILDALKRNGVRTQLWVTGGGAPTKSAEEQKQRVAAEVARLKPICEAAREIGCTVGLYNHGGWFGEPENQLEILKALDMPNVGLVYNQHHGHDHIDRFAALLQKMKPHLYCLNLNGITYDGEKKGKKILPIGAGELDLPLLQVIARSGYTGPIGILNHTDHDAEARLQDNLDGLEWLVKRLDGSAAGPRPKYRTYDADAASVPGGAAKAAGYAKPALGGGLVAAGRDEYRAAPITVECRATLTQKDRYNILVACDTKASAAHWEIFSLAGAGNFTAYLPGREPDHVHSSVNIADGQPHDLAMILEMDRVRLFVDGKSVADQAVKMRDSKTVPGSLAFGRLVEGQFFSEGAIEFVRISHGAIEPGKSPIDEVTETTLGLWRFDKQDAAEAADLSPRKNPAKADFAAAAAAMPPPQAPMPPPGVHLKPVDPKLKAVLIDRSENDVFMAVKCDSMGRLFVGGREAVFVYEPDDKGGYRPKQELFHFPQDSIIIGLELRGNDLYVLTNAALYLLPDARVKREGLSIKRLLWGLPLNLHVSFHCMAWGPEGDLFLNHGDPMLGYGDWSRPDAWSHWTYILADGTRVPYTGTGAVLRIRPDGTNLKVVATGLRGPVGLCFDPNWNLFTNDNDHESQADRYSPARLLHVTPHIDFGWPRGWMASKSPERSDLVDAMQDDHGRGVPCDMTWYREPLIPQLNDKLLVCRWERFSVTANTLKPTGSTFTSTEEVIAVGAHNARPSGICVGRDGRIFVTSLYLPGNVTSPYCPSDLVMLTTADDNAAHSFQPYDEMKLAGEDLVKDAAKVSWERQRRARNELARRGQTLERKISSRLWELDEAFEPTRALTEEEAWKIAAMIQRSDQHSLQTAARLMAEKSETAALKYLCNEPRSDARLVSLLAVGMRLTTPPRHGLLPANLPLHYEADGAFFKRNVPYVGEPAPIDLASIGRVGNFTTAEWWRAIERTPEQEELFALLVKALDDEDPRVQSQAAYYLSLLKDERSEPKIESARRGALAKELDQRPRVTVTQAWAAGPFPDGDKPAAHPPEQSVIDLSAEYATTGGPIRWEERTTGARGFTASGANSLRASTYLYFRLQSAARQPARLRLAGHENLQAWHNGVGLKLSPSGEKPGQQAILDLQPGSNDLLVRVLGRAVSTGLNLTVQARNDVSASLPEKLDGSLLAERLRSAAAAGSGEMLSPEFAALDWPAEAKNGDAERGRTLFGSLGCAKCHAITSDQKGGGAPSLAEAWRRFTVPQMVESLLLPSKQVAGPFRGTTVRTVDGEVLQGLVVGESKDQIELLLPDGSRRGVPAGEIDERKFSDLSPMPFGLVKTPEELRDLLAYLQLQSPVPP
jgi:putative heme-binding domain-containing protein